MHNITEYTQELVKAFAKLKTLAPVEASSTSTRAYTVGKFLILNSTLYKVTSAIAIGDLITDTGANANVIEAILTDEMGGGSASFPPGGNTGEVLRKHSSTNNDVEWGYEGIEITQAQYDALSQAEKEAGHFYIIDAPGVDIDAEDVTYSNTTSGMSATNVQSAVDEVNSDLAEKADKAQISNPNLLDNPWFTVNQRGFTDTLLTGGYTVDRWCARNTTGVSLSNGVLTLVDNRTDGDKKTWFGQRIELDYAKSLIEKPLTWSVMLSDGDIKTWTFTIPDDSTSKQSSDFTVNGNAFYLRFEWSSTCANVLIWQRNTNSTISIKAVKLELGAISTLALDTVPNYATELLKCQRYFVRIMGSNSSLVTGFCINGTNGANRFLLSLPVPMRNSAPTVTYSSLQDFKVSTSDSANGSNPTNIFRVGNMVGTMYGVEFTVVKASTGQAVVLYSVNTTGYLDFSADL